MAVTVEDKVSYLVGDQYDWMDSSGLDRVRALTAFDAIGDDMNDKDENWGEYKRHVLAELDRLDTGFKSVQNDLGKVFTAIARDKEYFDANLNKTKASLESRLDMIAGDMKVLKTHLSKLDSDQIQDQLLKASVSGGWYIFKLVIATLGWGVAIGVSIWAVFA